MSSALLASIIIPAFGRIGPLRQTLASAQAACQRLQASAEIVVVDDGSFPPLAEAAPELIASPLIRLQRQTNQGSIIARQTGLAAARGKFILFLDSDDLISPEKLRRHCERLSADPAVDITYDDFASPSDPTHLESPVLSYTPLELATDVPDLLLRVQPAPHGCMYRRTYLQRALAQPLVPAERSLDPSGDVWLYYNLSVHPAAFAKIDAALTFPGVHEEARFSQSWERLGVASLRLVERFMAATSAAPDPATLRAREVAGEVAFRSWRRLPRDFSPEFSGRLFALWKKAPHGPRSPLGGPVFCTFAMFLGAANAGRVMRQRNALYATCRTIDDLTLQRLLDA